MKLRSKSHMAGTWTLRLLPIAMFGVLAGCVVAPPVRRVAVPAPQPQRVFVYPAKGQSAEQQDRDRYECHVWAVQQTGVDPSRVQAGGFERVAVQPVAPTGTITGAIGGAIIGSVLSGRHDGGAGTLFGAATGAMIGSAADANAQAQQNQAQVGQAMAAERNKDQSYRRAMGACLEGRGYTVS